MDVLDADVAELNVGSISRFRSSTGLESLNSLGLNSWTLTSWRSGEAGSRVERSLRNLGGREYVAHRNEVILRFGEMPNGVHLILEGTIQVLALGEVGDVTPSWSTLEVGQLAPGEVLGVLPWLEKRPSRFSFRVQSKTLTALFLPAADITTKAANYLNERLAYREGSREDAWEASAWQHFEDKQRKHDEERARLKENMDFSGLKTRDGYVIPPECWMACHPNLPRYALRRRDPPPPKVIKSLPQIQREKRLAQMDEQQRPVEKVAEKEEIDLSLLLSMDGGHGKDRRKRMFGEQGVFHPKTSQDAKQWRKSDAYRFCEHYPVWQPALTEEDRRQGEKAEAEEQAIIAERNLRLSMGRMIAVLMQVKRVIKSGVGQLRGSRIRDTNDLLLALSPDQSEKIDRNDVADAIYDLGVAASGEHVEELVAQMDAENTGQIDREELADALTSPKRSVKQIYQKLRKDAETIEKSDSWFSSDGSESSRRLEEFESSEEDMPRMIPLSPRRMSLALPPEQQRPDPAAYNALPPARPLSAPIRKLVERPTTPKPVGKFHAMQCRLRRRQLRSAHKTNGSGRILMESHHEKSSRWPPSQSTEPVSPKLRLCT